LFTTLVMLSTKSVLV